jgi:hypothetical protein
LIDKLHNLLNIFFCKANGFFTEENL